MAETAYFSAMDSYPQEYEDSTRLYKFYDNLREGKLTTTKCKDCGTIHWPPRFLCPECLSENIEWVDMPKTGKIYSFTVAYGGLPPELVDKAPLVYALIDFDNGLRMLSGIVDAKVEEMATGLEVELVVGKLPPDFQGRERVIPYFGLKK